MTGNILLSVGIVFIALAVVFVGITVQDYLKETGKLTIARKTWLRVAFIFSGVGICLSFLNIFIK